jgi:hypothetical protein
VRNRIQHILVLGKDGFVSRGEAEAQGEAKGFDAGFNPKQGFKAFLGVSGPPRERRF